MALFLFSWLQQNVYDWEESIFMLIMIFIVEVMVTDWHNLLQLVMLLLYYYYNIIIMFQRIQVNIKPIVLTL